MHSPETWYSCPCAIGCTCCCWWRGRGLLGHALTWTMLFLSSCQRMHLSSLMTGTRTIGTCTHLNHGIQVLVPADALVVVDDGDKDYWDIHSPEPWYSCPRASGCTRRCWWWGRGLLGHALTWTMIIFSSCQRMHLTLLMTGTRTIGTCTHLNHDVLVLVPADALVIVDDRDEDLVQDVGPCLSKGVVCFAPASHQPHFSLKQMITRSVFKLYFLLVKSRISWIFFHFLNTRSNFWLSLRNRNCISNADPDQDWTNFISLTLTITCLSPNNV